jgi:hypothetical protein
MAQRAVHHQPLPSSRNGSIQAVIFSDSVARRLNASIAADPPVVIQGIFSEAPPQFAPVVFMGSCNEPHWLAGVLNEPCGISGSGCYGIYKVAVSPAPEQVKDVWQVSLDSGPTLYLTDAPEKSTEYTASLPTLPVSISDLVEAINHSEELSPVSPEMDALLDKVISCQGTTTNLEAWADQLADDVSNLMD